MLSNAVRAIDEFDEESAIELRDTGGFKGLFAREDIPKDAVIFHLKGTVSIQPSKYTIQLGHRRHLSSRTLKKTNDDSAYSWQYLNHNCEPNGYINIATLTFHALTDIARGEEITFNYLTTEAEMAVPFNCVCGAPNCFGFIRGRNFLTTEQAERLFEIVGANNIVAFTPAVRKLVSAAQKRQGREM